MNRVRHLAAAAFGLLLSLAAGCNGAGHEEIAPPAGTIRWPLWGPIGTVRAIAVGDDGTVYVGSCDGKVYAFKD